MNIYKLKLLLLATGAVFFTSCTSLLYTSLDVLRPANVAFATDANDLLIVNNTVNQPAEYGHRNELINEVPKNVLIKTDSMAIFCLGALTDDLEGKDFFSSVQLNPNTINQENDFFKSSQLNDETVKNLCLANHVNVVLSLDKIKVDDDLIENYLPESSTFLSTLELKFETSWSIHYLNKQEVTSVQYNDTVFWESESYNRKKAISDLPNREDALVDGALTVGHKAVNRFVPYWDKVDRYFFNPRNKIMKQGMDSVYVKNWKAAINLWESELNKTKSNWIQAQAANNIAIGYEITGDLDKALEYATKAYYSVGKMTIVDYQSFVRLSDYLNELTQRKKELDILKKQLGE
ncbi:MAG: DUF6340 family protein [Bacteroidota bacterium]|nr:DUF6340 family protein [Bacteroidota bacterium]